MTEPIRIITLQENILAANERTAADNRAFLKQRGILALNLISSPGSGKTTLLVETIRALQGAVRCAVIEGDQQTANDAERIAQTGAPVVQINTLSACHLEANLVQKAFESLPMDAIDLLFIENVGNLVCPAEYDLGETEKVVLMSITEGEDKPLKYPLAFHLASALVLTKMDLLPFLRFDLEKCKQNALKIHPGLPIIETSAYSQVGLGLWLDWLEKRVASRPAGNL
ncbi:hydrogenase nickel incorporation protein HypB [bacterium]|nr:hydrogenase nickel incorporation protein HypB [bacterium]